MPETRSSDARPLRIGVLCDNGRLAAWQADCLAKVMELDFAEVVLVVSNKTPQVRRPSVWRRLSAKFSSGLLLWRIYEKMVVDPKSLASRAVTIADSLASVPKIEVKPIRIGKFRQAFDHQSLECLKEHDLDVLLRFGFGILTGEILNLPRHGIWSFHHGDPEHFRGAPPGFWEIHNGAAVTGVILQRLTETLDGGFVLHEGWFKSNKASYPKSLDRILLGATHFVTRALTELQRNPEELMSRRQLENSGPIYRYPRTKAMLTFFSKTTAAKIRNQFNAFFRHQYWSVGVLNNNPVDIFESSSKKRQRIGRVTWLPQAPDGFLADPFPVRIAGEDLIIAEEFDWKTGRGHISTLPYGGEGSSLPQPVIRTDGHLSYPYTFDYGQESYCAPECAESNGVLLYRLLSSERRWVEHKRIIEDFPAVDPTIFPYGDRWWLFCTSAETGPNEYLYAWFADEPTGEWSAHPANPLKVDICSARPAGRPFLCRGTLIRPSQDCSEIYGGAITFNRVLKLTPEQFLEQSVGQLLPNMERPAGLHTICGFGEQTIVDGARLKFVPGEFWRAVLRFGCRLGQ